jgi:hypothetical protein
VRYFARRMAVSISLAVVAVLALLAVGSAPAAGKADSGSSGTYRGWTVIKDQFSLPILPLENVCNGNLVNMSGVLYIVTATSPPDSRGGVTVISTLSAPNLSGYTIEPQPYIEYRGGDGMNTYQYNALPPYRSSYRVLHWTKLVPKARNQPSMWLVVVIQETITTSTSGAAPVVKQVYLSCSEPKSHEDD